MMRADATFWIIGMMAVCLLLLFASQLSPESRLRRRRRKSHGRIISRSREPSVKLTVKPPKQ